MKGTTPFTPTPWEPTNEVFYFWTSPKGIRLDVALLINGVPVLFTETKSAGKPQGIADAWLTKTDVRTYHTKCPELLSIMQAYVLTHLIGYYYSATWNTSRKFLYNWKDEVEGDYETLVKSFLDRDRIVRVLTDFILFTRRDDELQKVILRPHQMRAVDKLVDRAADRDRQHGLVWHTQGSGKTYTMIVTAQKIMENPIFQNPTIVMLVDRNELESQLYGNLDAVGIEPEVADSKRELRDLLSSDRRGLIIALPRNTLYEAASSMSGKPSWFAIVAHNFTNVFLHERIAA